MTKTLSMVICLNMEDLLENDEFNDELLNYITQAGR